MNKNLTIAIDGPVGSGKGTLAVALAKKLGAFYLYTGGMYRALALACLRQNIDPHSEEKVLDLLGKISIELKIANLGTKVFLNNVDISDEIFSLEVTKKVPTVAAFSKVRIEMVKRQKKLIEDKTVVVEGRDSSTDVTPNADLKIYLTADIKTRTKRRLKQLAKRDVNITFDEVEYDVKERDRLDSTRYASPLKIVPDAYILDTTNLSIEETVNKVLEKLKEKELL